jgi:hypothetical protein
MVLLVDGFNAPSLPVLPLLTCAHVITGIQTTTPSVTAIRGNMPLFIGFILP